MQQAKQNFPIFPVFSSTVRKAVSGGVQVSRGCICHKPTRPRGNYSMFIGTLALTHDPMVSHANNLRVLTTRNSTATKGEHPNPENSAHQRKSWDHRGDQTKVIWGTTKHSFVVDIKVSAIPNRWPGYLLGGF